MDAARGVALQARTGMVQLGARVGYGAAYLLPPEQLK